MLSSHYDPETHAEGHGPTQVAPGHVLPPPHPAKRTGFSLTELWGWERGSPTFSA